MTHDRGESPLGQVMDDLQVKGFEIHWGILREGSEDADRGALDPLLRWHAPLTLLGEFAVDLR